MLKKYIHKAHETVKRNNMTLWNFSYISILQIFIIITPLITYPYLIRVLGSELYGWVILAQVVASYCTILIDFGFNAVSARHIAIHKDNHSKISEIISSILTIRFILWLCCFILYSIIIYSVTIYRNHLWLFIFSFGVTLNELLFPQFYFQGIEKMKYITVLNIIIRVISILSIFVFIKDANDYLLVPLLNSFSYFIGGISSLYLIFGKDKIIYKWPSFHTINYYLKDAHLLFFTNFISTIKDKLNYILLANSVAINQIVIYDFGSKITNILSKPADILCTVLLPKMAKEKNLNFFKIIATSIFICISILVIIFNLFLPKIVHFFITYEVDLLPIRIFSLAPIILGISIFIASNLMIAFGYNKYLLYSIFFTTAIYLLLLVIMFYKGWLNSVLSFITLTISSYIGELIYRLTIAYKIIKIESKASLS